MNLGLVPYGEAWELQRIARGRGRRRASDPGHGPAARAPADGHARPAHRGGGAAHPGRRRGRGRRDRPRRQVDVPRAGPARLLPDLRPEAARAGREAVLPRPRGGADPHARDARPRGERIDGLTGVWLTRPPRKIASIGVHIAQVGDDARLRAQRRPRPGAVHEWITACGLEDAAFTTIARELGRPVTVDEARAPPRSRRSRRSSGSSSRSFPPTTVRPLGPAGARPARRARATLRVRNRALARGNGFAPRAAGAVFLTRSLLARPRSRI